MKDLTGSINGWTCVECGGTTYAIHIANGVTPFMLGCRATEGCHGMAQSMFYPEGPVPESVLANVKHEFYKQTKIEARKAEKSAPGSVAHWRMGGLVIRPITSEGHALLSLFPRGDEGA